MTPDRDALYRTAAETYGAALERLARGYEAHADLRRDLLQEIHVAIWRSFGVFDGRCSLRTWVYRVAHNVAASHVQRSLRRSKMTLVGLDECDVQAAPDDVLDDVDRRVTLDRLMQLIHQLRPLDRQLMLLYLEGHDAASIGEITGPSPGNVATKVHRIGKLLANRFFQRSTR